MSSGIAAPPPLPADVPLVAPPTKHEGFIDQRLQQTRRQVKFVDVAVGLATLAVGVLMWLTGVVGGGIAETFFSATWTLAYRDLTGIGRTGEEVVLIA